MCKANSSQKPSGEWSGTDSALHMHDTLDNTACVACMHQRGSSSIHGCMPNHSATHALATLVSKHMRYGTWQSSKNNPNQGHQPSSPRPPLHARLLLPCLPDAAQQCVKELRNEPSPRKVQQQQIELGLDWRGCNIVQWTASRSAHVSAECRRFTFLDHGFPI